MAIEVIKPGLATSVQDAGRPGYYNIGIPLSGALDQYALRAANLQVAAGAIFLGSDAELPLGIHVEGDVDQRLARAGRRDLRHLEQAEPLVEGDQLALTLKGPELDG